MEALTKPPLRTTDRLHQTLAALARLLDQTMNDLQVLDSEFQERVLKAAMETEASAEQQAAERLKIAVKEAEQNTRAQVTEELETRLNQQVATAVEAARNELAAERVQLSQELERLRQSTAGWEAERAQLMADCQHANQLLQQAREEHGRSLALTDEAAAIALERQVAKATDRVRAEAAARWDAERGHLAAQRDRAFQSLADLDTEHQQSLAASERLRSDLTGERDRLRRELEQATHTSAQLESERNRLRDECEQARRNLAQANLEQSRLMVQIEHANSAPASIGVEESSVKAEAIYAEVTRVEKLIHSISRIIEDPATELSLVIRRNAERAELESYLRGLRFKIPGR
jgi:chromosome segregation ATPase